MEQVRKRLIAEFWVPIALCAIIVLLGELNIIPTGKLEGNDQIEFILLAVMEMVTICMIPLALRLFRFKKVKSQLVERREKGLQKWVQM